MRLCQGADRKYHHTAVRDRIHRLAAAVQERPASQIFSEPDPLANREIVRIQDGQDRADEAGAVVLFHGVARNNSEGRRVVALEYDAYPSMAEKKLREVADEVRARFLITGIAIHHRTGRLAIGEASLLVAVSAPHRREAFEACHHAVDRIKQVVPIWKKEIWEDGEGAWVAGHAVDVPASAEASRR